MASGTTRLRVHSTKQSQVLPLSFTLRTSFFLLSAALYQGTYKCQVYIVGPHVGPSSTTYSEAAVIVTYL